ncbi:hypothetical protein [Bacillus sp. AK128]
MKPIPQDQLYLFTSICFAFGSVAFLVSGILGGFKPLNMLLPLLFAINAFLFFTIHRVNKNKQKG